MLQIAQLLLLILVANGAPILARKLLRDAGSYPLDAGIRLADGEPLFGVSKTQRGLLASLAACTATALLLGLPASIGLQVAIGAMCGDLLSSFIKRRLHMAPSDRAAGLDQIPESLLPAWLVAGPLQLGTADTAIVVGAFIVLDFTLSRLLFLLKIRNRPY
jgi:CDP-2,3-bis-(O-geranylgeranyl)-sn-glycerol synthase